MKAPHFALFTLLFLVILLQPTNSNRVLFKKPSSYNTFMRQVDMNYEKAKVETLGDIFKRHVQQLRHTPNKMVELVFLVDSSGTVGRSYFFEEIRFVRNLLADFTVDVNSTRVSVITFSSPNKIYRHIDYLTKPNQDNHKCRLLIEDIPLVEYTPGGTHTLGAFLEAEKVLKSARPDAVKAIFLMTDGYSNGGDPRPVAKKLKRQGVKIFTFGIRDGFVWELQDMASEPKNETCYILDSFEEFEALAKRALHADLQSGTYVEQPMKKCKTLCTTENLCCHDNATCSCGTYTGKYECLCKPGHYGTGRGKVGCKPCPPGTYKNFTGLGDTNICTPCPDEHQTTPEGAASISQCVCKRGYHSFGAKECTVFRCPDLPPPKHGYFVNNKCNNVFNAACGLRCQHGYELRGSSLRICQDDGTWSGQDAECIMKTCPTLPTPKNGHMICSSDDFSYSTICRFTCNAGYQLVGSRKRTCLAIAYWTGIATICREITCPPLVEIKDATITPASCTAKEVIFGSTCYISCLSGYTLKGPHNKQCTTDGTWLATGSGVNQCVDEAPPVLRCPDNIEVDADEFEDTTEVTWVAPVPVDNSGFRPVLTSDPAVTPGSRFSVGTTIIVYKAEDLSLNVAKCKFIITVADKTPPQVDKCKSPPPIISLQNKTEVALEPPIFSDNSGLPVEVASSVRLGELFPMGTTVVSYTAFDSANNNSTCKIEVQVIPHLCVIPNAPEHGNVSCSEGEIGVKCYISCTAGYAFAIPAAEEYFCAYRDGRWTPEDKFPFPDCAVVQISNNILQPAVIALTGDLSCKDQVLIYKIQQSLEGTMEDKLSSVCENEISCSVGSLKSVCEEEEDFNKIELLHYNKERKKRAVREYPERARMRRDLPNKRSRITFELVLEGSVTKKGNATQKSNAPDALITMLTTLQKEARKGNLDQRVGGRTLKFSQFTYDLDLKTYRCPEGSVLVNNTCVNCPIGTFFHVVIKRCLDCPKGTYQPEEGHNTCLRCPDNKSTDQGHAKSEQDCKALCLPGSFSPSGLEPCETCALGSYQSDYSADFCYTCRKGKTTHKRGSRREEDCTEVCPAGHASPTGLAPCTPCPLNSYQPKSGQAECIQCASEGSIPFPGSSSEQDCIYPLESMELQSDFSVKKGGGDQLRVPFSPCFESPCENGGTCQPAKFGQYKCLCRKGFTGTNCDVALDLCEGKPCHNGGTCLATPGGFQCLCKDGFTGTNCEINIDECRSSPCLNKGVCIDGINSFTCNCRMPYTGTTCSSTVNDCTDAVCLNGGTCVNTPTSFKCQCPTGYTGDVCEIDVDECMSAPCQNGGSCQDLPRDYKCTCKRGYTGKSCETEIDECADSPCQNGARCEDLLDDYKCHCVGGFSGKKCEKVLASQYQLDFVTPTILDYAELTIDQPMTTVTASFWIKTSDQVNQGTPFSYAVSGDPNAFTVTNYKNLVLLVNGEQRNVGVNLTDGVWHHVALSWSSFRGDWKAYVDGILSDQGYDLSTGKTIPGKGIFIVGQEQDTFGGGFSPGETFVGSISQLNVFDQELPWSDIGRLRFSCDSFQGNVISWSAVQAAVKGSVAQTPSYFCQDCPTPTAPRNGGVNFTDTKPGSQVDFRCDLGYSMTGKAELKCLVSGQYDGEIPECIITDCGNPGRIRNGFIKGKDFTYGKTVIAECNPGYEIRGEKTLTCTDSGFWDFDTPDCVEKQCTVPELSENTVPSTTKKRIPPGTSVSFSCKEGSALQTQHNSVKCQKDGTWDKSVPSCDEVKCTFPPPIENGEPFNSIEEYNVGDSVSYQCDYGYEFNTAVPNTRGSLACLPTGNWEPDLPVCGPVRCPDPPPIYDAVANGAERTFMSQVTYSCVPGFLPSGKNVIECEQTRDWSPTTFSCTPVDCGAPAKIDHGTLAVDSFIYNSLASYQCQQGYTLDGDEDRRCQEDGTWSGGDPVCNPVSCGALAPITNGKVIYNEVTFSSTAEYTCDAGFELRGSPEINCEASGLWAPEPPTCQPRACPMPQDVEFGSYTILGSPVYRSQVNYTCGTGYILIGASMMTCQEDGTWSAAAPVCERIECPDLDSPQHGSVTVFGKTYTSVAGYSCSRDYKISGVDTRICQIDGTWSNEAPTCLPTKCPSPDQVSNGRLDYKDLSIGSIVRYSCDRGYSLEGDASRRCQDDLTLTGQEPICQPVDCGELGSLDNGAISVSDQRTIYNTVATLSCDQGYTLKGDKSIKCEADGKWSSRVFSCAPVECTNVSSVISNGKTNGTNSTYRAVIAYECDVGFKLQGAAIRRCLSSGNWDAPIPICETVECPAPKLSHGTISSFQRTYGTVVDFSCRGSYRLEGASRRTCTATGEWSGDEPKCLKINCKAPDRVSHSESEVLNETAIKYECHRGYTLVGAAVRICGSDEIWRPAAPVCQIVSCPDLSQDILEDGNITYSANTFGEFVSYTCKTGYRLRGDEKRRCQASGLWEGQKPSCEIVSCGHPGLVSNGHIEGDDYSFNSTVSFLCNKGFKLVGANALICLASGRWGSDLPYCDRITCPELNFPNGTVTILSSFYDGIAEYSCNKGYQVVGNKERKCLETEEWSGNVPNCTVVFCPMPAPIEHAILESNSTGLGAELFYTCEEGYNLFGDFTRVCQQNGNWSNEPPDCSPVICPEPSWPENGIYMGESGTYRSLLTYQCLEGYELVGSEGRVCQANATWSGTDPECRKISCGSPPTIENAFILQQDDDLYESQVVYDCVEGYSASGQDVTSCLSNRTWSYLDLTCTILSCPTIDIPNAVFDSSSLTYQTNVSISCREGYNLAGVSHIICTADGSWSHAHPSCLLVQCPQLGELRFGTVASTSKDYGSLATFSCNTGYNLVGVQQVECLSAGAWSAAMPSCQIVTCQAPQSPVPNGQLVGPKLEYYYQDQISYICDYGYEISGHNLMTCLATGQFDSSPPACVRIPCPTPESIDFGQFTFEDSLTVGYECQIGYEIAGNSRLTCLLGGAWSGLAPSCVPVICPTPSQIENGFIEGDNFTFGYSIVYKCYLGYQLEGDSTRVCQANRSWSHPEPQCDPISCGPPTEPFENGVISGEYIFGSGVEYFCSPGFELAGESFRQCQADGSWENSKPECIRLSCLAPTSIPFGVISGSSYLFEDNITYSCIPGYQLQGESLRTCVSSLEWSGQEPACVRVSCGPPFSLENGQVLGSSYLYLDQVNLTCNFGYRLVGVNSSVCDASGLWSGGLPICEQILCLSPPVVDHGRIVRDVSMGKYVVQSLVGYECDVGYTMNGTAEKICQETGNWSDNLISCHPVSCGNITTIDYGTVLGSDYIYLSVLNFTCNHGFELVGSSSLQCDHTGSWSAQKPYCKVMSCPALTVVNGYANINPGDGSDIVPADQRNSTYIYKDVATFFCNEGYEIVGELTSQCQVGSAWSNTNTTCMAVQCPKPEIQNAVVPDASLTFGSVVTITCHSGYDLIGESELTCGADKNWIEPLPQCVLLACGSPPSVVNAIIVGDSFKQGDAISYKCRPGYEAVGNTVIVCGLANQWLGTLPTCTEVDCGPPPVFPASTVTVATTTYRSFAEVLCNSGYVLNGNGTLVCSADRTWRYDSNLRCDPRDCGQPPDIDHSSFSVDDTTLGGVAVYMCATGYLMMGGSSLFCDEDGVWRQEYPKCSPVDCSTPPDVPNANFLSAGTLYLDKVEYACHTGYKLATSNATELVCGEMATWEGEIPVCEVVNCGWPSQVLDSYYFLDNNRTDYLSLAVYHCNAGYTSPLPDNVLNCNAFGVWEGELISCAPVDCADYPQLPNGQYSPGNGTKYQSVARYDCVRGYVKTGPDVITCLETGKWSSDDLACLPLDCQDPPSIENGDLDFNETTFQSRVTYSCLPGFYLGGKDNIECLESGFWSGSAPTCVPVDCKTPSSIEHGWANYTSSTFQNLAIYSCQPGYTLGPHSTLICGETGEWQGIEPHCVIVNCTEPVPKPNGRVVYTTLTYRSVALFTCEPGFRLEGRATISCTETGQWSDESPPCSPLDCSNPIRINHGDVVVSGTTFGASATYSCHVGYTLVGQHQIYCNEQGAWNSSAPSCEVVDCKTPLGLDNGEVIFSSTTYLSLATYGCSNGFKLTGQSTVVCMESGSWFSSEEAKCEPVTCPEPTAIAHGEVTYTELKVGLTAVYQCLAGYVMSGTGALLCGEDGSWQGNAPTCQLIVCPSPPDIINGYVLSSSTHVGAAVEYVCSTGFIHDGITSIECLADGMWSSELPVCKRIKCAAPPVIANSIVIADTGRSVTSRVTFSCVKGYQMINDKDNEITITCGDDGDWFGKIPSCEIVVCYDPPPTIPFSTFVTTGDTYTSEAIYTCNVGYAMAGNNKIMCNHVGQWLTDDPPQCAPISCSQPREFPLSTFEGTDFTFGKSVNYTCIPGHDLTGSSTSYCNSDGQWSTVAFQCTVRHCSSLVAVPENGEIISGPENGSYIVGSVITFKCLGEYSLVGPASMRCAETGEWDASQPQCQSIIDLCSETLIMDNIHPPPPGKLTGNHIIIQCLPGYVAVGNMTSVCQRDGNWTLPQGQCQRVFCDKPVVGDTQKVMLLGRSYFYGDKVVFMCRHGFNSVPTPPVLTCLETGRWDAEPLCIAHCKQECLNGGHCLGFNRCKCMTGWGGTSCQIANCILPCLHGGHCVAPYKCQCPLGFEGTRCQKAICSQPCQNGGRCLRPNKCQCPSGFVGDFCESMTLARKRQLNINIS